VGVEPLGSFPDVMPRHAHVVPSKKNYLADDFDRRRLSCVLSHTQENAVDLHSVGRVLNTPSRRGENIHTLSESISFHDLLSIGRHLLGVSFRSLKVRFTNCCSHTVHYRRTLYYPTRTKHDCTSAEYTFNWNTSVSTHQQGATTFRKCKQLPRSAADFSINNGT
jgi:hypothetical protein